MRLVARGTYPPAVLAGRIIHLGVGGGIAAYKAAELVRQLQRDGATVRVAMTPNATHFVGPLTFQALTRHAVLTRTLDPGEEVAIGHIDFAQCCDALVIAPTTANLIGKVAHGIGDEVVAAALLAAPGPVYFAPAMNTVMWRNAAVRANLSLLRARGHIIVEPTAGELACGAVGPGRMAEPASISRRVAEGLALGGTLRGRRVLVTAGPTREHIDAARFLSNPSTGRAGFEIASAAARAGAEVVLVHGPVTTEIPAGVDAIGVITALEMRNAVEAHVELVDAVVMTAAIADFRPAVVAIGKLRKTEVPDVLPLVRNPDVLAGLGAARRGLRPVLVGFAAETDEPVRNADAKLRRKRVDMVVANDIGAEGSGFGTATNRVWFVEPDRVEDLPLMSKREVGERLVAWLVARLGATEIDSA